MNSEFPMSFIEEQPTQKKSKPKLKSNVVALSRPQDSILHSSVDSEAQHNRNPQDYALSQFDDSASSGGYQSASRGRLFARGALLTVFTGLWVAIGTGYLHSESPAIAKIRAHLPAQLSSMTETSAETLSQSDKAQSAAQPSELSNEVNAAISASSMPVTQNAATSSSTVDVSASSSVASSASTVNTPAAVTNSASVVTSTDSQSVVKNPVSPIPEEQGEPAMSEYDIRKTLKMLRQQQQQLLDFQDHMSKLIAGMDQNAVLDQELKDLEEQHLQAAKMLKERRAKLRQ